MSNDVVIERSLAAGVIEVRLNRPEKKNALSIAVRDLLSDALDRAAQDHSVSVVVIAATGDTFSAGFDLSEFAAAAEDTDLDRALWASSDRYHHRVLSFPLPILAAINGAALAGGFDLATMCDIRVASKSARFARPESSFGPIMYGPLHDMVGSSIARDLSFSGRSVQAEEALRLGLVSRVVDDAELDAEVATLASHIAATPRDLLLNHKAKMIARAGIGDRGTLAL
jgi:enoyl-CoA hydratase/carnithine racemase